MVRAQLVFIFLPRVAMAGVTGSEPQQAFCSLLEVDVWVSGGSDTQNTQGTQSV
jgi:hypothetical protein